MSTKFTCRFCKELFDVPKGLYKHLQTVHNAGVSRDNYTCPICGVLCSKYEGYRDHLLYIHGQSEDGLKLTFKTLNEFLVWKTELELKHDCKYVLQTSPKVLPSKEKKYFYQCDRSNSKSNSKKSSVVMKTCSSVISVVEGTGVFRVEYWDSHSNHCDVQPPKVAAASAEIELEAAINSVEMVSALAESDDSFERTEDILMMESSDSTLLNVEKQQILSKINFPTTVNNSPKANTTPKTKTIQSFPKFDSTKKKNANTSGLFSLASVACGKGITKKSSNKSNDDKSAGNQSVSELETSLDNMSENSSKTLAGISTMKKDNAKSQESTTTIKSVLGESKVKTTMPSSILVTNKTTSSNSGNSLTNSTTSTNSGNSVTNTTTSSNSANSLTNTTTSNNSGNSLLTKTTSSISGNFLNNKTISMTPIMPKLSTVSNNSMNSLYAANSAFPNQLVIMNPVGMDQNSLNSNRNVLTTGQNILFSLGPVGQNVVPVTTTTQNVNSESSKGDKKTVSGNAKVNKSDTSLIGNVSNTVSSTKMTAACSNNATSTIVSSITPNSSITLPPTLNNAPVILSSLPVGSTFMSVNNNLIPIASPSGAFIPTSLPPNIVLTPVMPGSNLATVDSSKSTSLTQARYTPSSLAITVSSIVKEPLYTASTAMSSVSPISTQNARTKIQNKFVPITSVGKSLPNKETFNLSPSKNLLNAITKNPEISLTPFSPKGSARKKISRSIKSTNEINSSLVMSKATTNSIATVSTKVVNSQLSVTPISSTPNVTITPLHKPGTVLFESAGELFMLEPIDNDDSYLPQNDNSHRITIKPPSQNNAKTLPPNKSLSASKAIKIDRAMQTNDSYSNLTTMKSKFQRKRAAPPTDDSAVMLKVKCYQLEMKYMNSQTECKRLKVELTKERLKNAELRGENIPANIEDESASESRTNASEIMKEIEEKYSETKDVNIYTITKTSTLRSLYEDLEELCIENGELYKELENYRAHDKFYQSLKKKLHDEEF